MVYTIHTYARAHTLFSLFTINMYNTRYKLYTCTHRCSFAFISFFCCVSSLCKWVPLILFSFCSAAIENIHRDKWMHENENYVICECGGSITLCRRQLRDELSKFSTFILNPIFALKYTQSVNEQYKWNDNCILNIQRCVPADFLFDYNWFDATGLKAPPTSGLRSKSALCHQNT